MESVYTIKDLVSNLEADNLSNKWKLRETLDKIYQEITEQQNPIIVKNLKSWARKYEKRLNLINNFGNSINFHGRIKEEFIEEYIYINGLDINGDNVKEFERQYEIPIGRIDLLGKSNKGKYIIELKSYNAKSENLGQLLAYWGYFKSVDKTYTPVLVATGYRESYKIAYNIIKNIVKIINIKIILEDGIEFKKINL